MSPVKMPCDFWSTIHVVARMTRGVNAQQFAAIERDAGVVGCFDDAFGWDRQDFTVDFFSHSPRRKPRSRRR